MTHAPSIIPNTQTTTMNGMVDTTPVSSGVTSQSYPMIGPRTPQGYAQPSPQDSDRRP
jgi:hypothetical protein